MDVGSTGPVHSSSVWTYNMLVPWRNFFHPWWRFEFSEWFVVFIMILPIEWSDHIGKQTQRYCTKFDILQPILYVNEWSYSAYMLITSSKTWNIRFSSDLATLWVQHSEFNNRYALWGECVMISVALCVRFVLRFMIYWMTIPYLTKNLLDIGS